MLVAAALALTFAAAPAHASSGISTAKGIDACGLQTDTGAAQAFWSGTPYSELGIYVGGDHAGCPSNGSFASSVLSMGWLVMPIWVGPQSACGEGGISQDTGTAYSQGTSEEESMYHVMKAWGWDTTNTPVIYDLEGYDTSNSDCISAAQSFISGWDANASLSPPQIPGVYGSDCGSDLSAFAGLGGNTPAFIDSADWDGDPSTWDLACTPSGEWTGSQRFKQYQGDHDETWNGYTVSVDSDCANGPVYPIGASWSQGCA